MTPAHGSSQFVAFAALMFVAGVGIPIMATLNSGLGRQLASPALATAILYAIGLLLALALLAIKGMPAAPQFGSVTPLFYFGAVFVVFYIFAITLAAPKIGIGNAVFFVLLGQLVAAAAIDHFGLWGALATPITAKRVLGIAVMAFGVWLARKPV